MHARYYSPLLGRFLSADPKQRRKGTAVPQSWNRFAYALGNPVSRFDPNGEDSFLVSRPLKSASSRAHLFIVTYASGPGDRRGRVRSFGELPNGNMGEVQLNTTGSRSEGTKLRDTAMWYSLTDPAQAETAADVVFVQIDAPDDAVAATADALMPNQGYSLSIGVRGVNSNSAAVAVAETASGQDVRAPGDRPAPGAEDSDMVDFDFNGDGIPDELEPSP